MNQGYTRKVVVSGNLIELYDYEQPVITSSRKGAGRRPVQAEPSPHQEKYRRVTVYRNKTSFKRLYACNFTSGNTTLTLTFDPSKMPHTHDLSICKRHFKKFISMVRRRFGEVKYLGVVEYTQQGAIHFHVATNLPRLKRLDIQTLWKHGGCWVSYVRGSWNSIKRSVRYLTKGFQDSRWDGKHYILRSRNLIPARIITDSGEDSIIDIPDGDMEIEKSTIDSAYLGKVIYEAYFKNHEQGGDGSG